MTLKEMILRVRGCIENKKAEDLSEIVPSAHDFFRMACATLSEKYPLDDFKNLKSMDNLLEFITSKKTDLGELADFKDCFCRVMSDEKEYAQDISYLYIICELVRKSKPAKSDPFFIDQVTALSRILRSHVNFNYHNKSDATFLDETDRKNLQDDDGKPKKTTKLYPSPDTPTCYIKPDRVVSDAEKNIKYFSREDKKFLKVKLEDDVLKRAVDSDKMPAGTYIYVITKKGGLYARNRVDENGVAIKHSSFKAGKAVMCAGEIEVDCEGQIASINHKSGHYMPNKFHLAEAVSWLSSDHNKLMKDGCEVVYYNYDHDVRDGSRQLDAKSFLDEMKRDYGYMAKCASPSSAPSSPASSGAAKKIHHAGGVHL